MCVREKERWFRAFVNEFVKAPQRTAGLLEPHINSFSIAEPQTAQVKFKLDTQTADTLNYRRSRAMQSGYTQPLLR